MINRFRDLSIRRKLIAMLLLTNALLLALVSVAFVANEATRFRGEMHTELSALAEIIGNNCSAAVAFNDRQAAGETLAALRAKPYIRAAVIILQDGTVLAGYQAPGNRRPLPFTLRARGRTAVDEVKLADTLARSRSPFAFGHDIYGVYDIVLDRQRIGTVVVQSDAREFADRLARFFYLVAGVMVSKVVEDPSPMKLVFDPNNPHANADGYVTMPNVNVVEEMTNMISASRSYQANVEMMNTAKTLVQRTLALGQG